MSKKEKRSFIKTLLSEGFYVKGINGKVRLNDMFSRGNNAVVVLKRKNGTLLTVCL